MEIASISARLFDIARFLECLQMLALHDIALLLIKFSTNAVVPE